MTRAKSLKGEKVEKRLDTGVTLVTKENMDQPEVKVLWNRRWPSTLTSHGPHGTAGETAGSAANVLDRGNVHRLGIGKGVERRGRPGPANDDGGWSWFEDERAIVVDGKLLAGSVAMGRPDATRRGNIEAVSLD